MSAAVAAALAASAERACRGTLVSEGGAGGSSAAARVGGATACRSNGSARRDGERTVTGRSARSLDFVPAEERLRRTAPTRRSAREQGTAMTYQSNDSPSCTALRCGPTVSLVEGRELWGSADAGGRAGASRFQNRSRAQATRIRPRVCLMSELAEAITLSSKRDRTRCTRGWTSARRVGARTTATSFSRSIFDRSSRDELRTRNRNVNLTDYAFVTATANRIKLLPLRRLCSPSEVAAAASAPASVRQTLCRVDRCQGSPPPLSSLV